MGQLTDDWWKLHPDVGFSRCAVPPSRRSFSNRKGTSSKNEGRQVVGIDKLAVSFPVDSWDTNPDEWPDRSENQRGDTLLKSFGQMVPIDGHSVYLGVRERWFEGVLRQTTGKLEYNPSRVVDPAGCGLASVGDAMGTFPVVVGATGRWVDPAVPSCDFRLTRIDPARDFEGIEQPTVLIRALGSLHRPYSRKNLVHADVKRNGAQTLVVGGKASDVRLYDKYQERKGREVEAARGTVRWEAQSRKEWNENYGGIKWLGDIDDESVGQLARDRWEWSQMGAEVAGDLSRLVERVHAADLSRAQRRAFLGWLVEQAAGMEAEVESSATLAKYRRLQRELGIAAPVELLATVKVLRRLDWETGRELQRVA